MIKTLIVQSPKERHNRLNALYQRQFSGRCEAICATTMTEAVSIIRSENPQLVIVDIAPEFGLGFQLFEETAEFKNEKIVICENSDYAIKAMRYHVADYLLKPLQGDQLVSAVEKLLFAKKEYKIQQLYDAKFKKTSLVSLAQAVLPIGSKKQLFDLSNLVRIHDLNEMRKLILVNGETLDCDLKIGKLQSILAGTGLVRIDRETILSVRHIEKLWTEDHTPWLRMVDGFQTSYGFKAEHLIRKYFSLQLPETPSLGHVSNC